MDKHNEGNKEIIDELLALPENDQRVLVWFAKHYDLVVDICGQEVLSQEQREQFMREAMEKDDTLLMLFVLLEKRLHGGK